MPTWSSGLSRLMRLVNEVAPVSALSLKLQGHSMRIFPRHHDPPALASEGAAAACRGAHRPQPVLRETPGYRRGFAAPREG